MAATPHYWFRAKSYGWGWGMPSSWQGWLVGIVWLGALLAGVVLLRGHTGTRLGFVTLMIALLVGICYLKGEPPRWRWGRGGA
jgi:hypothetical protein